MPLSYEEMVDRNLWEDIPEIVCFSHRYHPEYFQTLLGSIGRETPGTYRVLMSVAPGRCLESQDRALRQARSKRVLICDEDIEIISGTNWLEILLNDLRYDPTLAIVGTGQVKTEEAKFDYLNGLMDTSYAKIEEVLWAPCHLWAIARDRIPWIFNDKALPGIKGAHDLDMCLQVRKAGFKVAVDSRVVVYHPNKEFSDESRIAIQNPTLMEEHDVYPLQVAYLVKKWGSAYIECCPSSFAEPHLSRIRQECEKLGVKCPW